MSDDQLKKELFYMVRLASKYDFTDKAVSDEIKKLDEDQHLLSSVFGKRFLDRITEMGNDNASSRKCVICGRKIAINGVICQDCMNSILNSGYAKEEQLRLERAQAEKKVFVESENNLAKLKKKKYLRKPLALKTNTTISRVLHRLGTSKIFLVILIILLVINATLCVLLFTPILEDESVTANEEEVHATYVVPDEPLVIDYTKINVSSMEDAYALLDSIFPVNTGWYISAGTPYEADGGDFGINSGECLEDVIENLTDDERYNFFYDIEPCYQFFISYKEDGVSMVGIALVNSEGKILTMGSFGDGRKTDAYYRIR